MALTPEQLEAARAKLRGENTGTGTVKPPADTSRLDAARAKLSASEEATQRVMEDLKKPQPGMLSRAFSTVSGGIKDKVSGTIEAGKGFLKGAGETVAGLGNVVEKGLAEATRAVGITPLTDIAGGKTAGEEIMESGVFEPTNTAQEVGKGIESVAEFLVPGMGAAKGIRVASSASKLAKAFPFLAKAAEKVGLISADAILGGAQSGLHGHDPVKAAKESGLISAAVNTVLPGGAFIAKEAIKNLSSKLSGVPVKAIEEAFARPQAIGDAMRKAAQTGDDVAITGAVNKVKEALGTVVDARNAAHETALKRLGEEMFTTKKGQLYVKKPTTVNGKDVGEVFVPTDLSLKGVKDVLTRTLTGSGKAGQGFGVTGSAGSFDFGRAALDGAHKNSLKEVVDTIYGWDDVSPLGLNQLRRVIDGYKKGGGQLAPSSSKQFDKILGSLTKNLGEYVSERVPQIGEMNRAYAKASEVVEDFIENLNLNSKRTVIGRQLQNLFNPKSGPYKKIVDELGEASAMDLTSDVAGALLSRNLPEGLGAYLGAAGTTAGLATTGVLSALPALLASLAFSSPRIVGEVVTGAGKIAPSVSPVLQGAQKLAPAIPEAME